jgi:hypothetical protein
MPFIGDVLPDGWEDADGTRVNIPWSSLFGKPKPSLSAPNQTPRHNTHSHIGFADQRRYRFIIKVASPVASPLDKIAQEIFAEPRSLTQPERPQYVPNYMLPRNQ